MDPHYNYVFSTLLPPHVIRQPVEVHPYQHIPIHQMGSQTVCFSEVPNAEINSAIQPQVIHSNITPLLNTKIHSTRPRYFSPNAPHIHSLKNSKVPLLLPVAHSQNKDCHIPHYDEALPHPVPLISLNLPKVVNDKIESHFSPSMLNKANKRKNRNKIQGQKRVLTPDASVDCISDEMSAKLHIVLPSTSDEKTQGKLSSTNGSGGEHKQAISTPHHKSSDTKCDSGKSFGFEKHEPKISKRVERCLMRGTVPLVEEETVTSTEKSISWAAIAATLPKPIPSSSMQKRYEPVYSIEKSSQKAEKCRQKCLRLLQDTSAHVGGHSTTTKRFLKPRKRKNCNTRSKITPEEREQLLTRYRSRLEKQITSSIAPKVLIPTSLKPPKKKRVTRLKAGILRDRLVRRALHSLLEEQQKQIDNTAKKSEEQKFLTPSAILMSKPKVEKIELPVIPSLEDPIKEMLTKLAGFQDRAFKQTENAPGKRKNARRIVCGFHEVIKSLKVKKLKFFIVANDLEKGAYEIEVESPQIKFDVTETSEQQQQQQSITKTNSLALTLKQAVDMSHEQGCPVVKAFRRRYLQKLCHKGAPVSCAGVINVAGAEDIAKSLREQYLKEVGNVKKTFS